MNLLLLFAAVVSKLVPLTVTEVVGVPIVGLKLVIVGALDVLTVKDVALEAEPPGEVTAITPVVADEGTVVTI